MDTVLFILDFASIIMIVVMMTMISEEKFFTCVFSFLLIFFSILTGGVIEDMINIDPIEVYRGNTQLKITEKRVNNVVIERDSVVILKR